MSQFNYAGVSLQMDASILTDSIRRSLRAGIYECEETECVELYLEADDDVVELGGGIGYLSCYVDQRLRETSTHVVVEPNAHLVPLVERHRKINDADFEIVTAAYTRDTQLAELPLPDRFMEASLQLDSSCERSIHPGTVDIEALLDAFDLTDIALIVDIEGGEAELIEEELDTLLSHCRLLIVEFHCEGSPPELAERLQSAKEMLASSEFVLLDRNGSVRAYRSPDTEGRDQ